MTEITMAQLGWLLGIVATIYALYASTRNVKRQDDASAREMATILTKLDYMSRQMEQMQGQVAGFNTCMMDMATRLGATEKSVERAHVRIDKLEVQEP